MNSKDVCHTFEFSIVYYVLASLIMSNNKILTAVKGQRRVIRYCCQIILLPKMYKE